MTETTIATIEDMLGDEIKVSISEAGVELYISGGHAILGEVCALELVQALIAASITIKETGTNLTQPQDSAHNPAPESKRYVKG